MTEPFILGVNYWPRRKAMYWWSDFDAAEVREEFQLIADLGMQVVRLFLLWEDWQPTPNTVSSVCLANLITTADIAASCHLRLNITFFTGHMSGPNWSPAWLRDSSVPFPTPDPRPVVTGGLATEGSYRSPFTDPAALSAERLLLQVVVDALKDHPAVWMWNLGNEPDLFALPPDAESGRAWVRDMTVLIHHIDPVHPVTLGLHAGSLFQANGLRIDHVFHEVDTAVMHSYPMYVPGLRPLDPNWVPFTCALVTALCGKPALMEEWGGCTSPPAAPSQVWNWTRSGVNRSQFMASEEDFAGYVEQVLPKLIEVGATGSFIWCFADYASDLWTRPPCDTFLHERFFGLVRPDGTLKPHAEVIRKFASSNPVVSAQPARTVALDITPDEYYDNPIRHIERLYRQYLETYQETL